MLSAVYRWLAAGASGMGECLVGTNMLGVSGFPDFSEVNFLRCHSAWATRLNGRLRKKAIIWALGSWGSLRDPDHDSIAAKGDKLGHPHQRSTTNFRNIYFP